MPCRRPPSGREPRAPLRSAAGAATCSRTARPGRPEGSGAYMPPSGPNASRPPSWIVPFGTPVSTGSGAPPGPEPDDPVVLRGGLVGVDQPRRWRTARGDGQPEQPALARRAGVGQPGHLVARAAGGRDPEHPGGARSDTRGRRRAERQAPRCLEPRARTCGAPRSDRGVTGPGRRASGPPAARRRVRGRPVGTGRRSQREPQRRGESGRASRSAHRVSRPGREPRACRRPRPTTWDARPRLLDTGRSAAHPDHVRPLLVVP